MNDVTDSTEKRNIESKSQRGIVINTTTPKIKRSEWRCLPSILNM